MIPVLVTSGGSYSGGGGAGAYAALAAISGLPENRAVVPRDAGASYATLDIAGSFDVDGTMWPEVVAQIVVGGVVADEYDATIVSRDFSVAPLLPAARVDHELRVVGRDGATEKLLAVRKFVAAGFCLIVDGQSNSVAGLISGSAAAEVSPWVRTYGYRTPDAPTIVQYTYWGTAEVDAAQGLLAIGQWAGRFGNQLSTARSMPVGIISQGLGGIPIAAMTRNPADPDDVTTHCGRTLWRAQNAGIADKVRHLVYWQGESDSGDDGINYTSAFTTLRDGWLADYPALERIYVVQVRLGYTSLPLLDAQRKFGESWANVTVIASTGIDGNDGLHYYYTGGYQTFGDWLKAIIERDEYGIEPGDTDSLDVASASISGDVITVTLKANDASTISVDAGAETYFLVDGGRTVSAVTVVGGNLQVTLAAGAGTPTQVSYYTQGGPGAVPTVRNARGMGLLGFSIPIT